MKKIVQGLEKGIDKIRIILIKMVDPIHSKGLHTNIINFQNMWYDDDDECFCCCILWSY